MVEKFRKSQVMGREKELLVLVTPIDQDHLFRRQFGSLGSFFENVHSTRTVQLMRLAFSFFQIDCVKRGVRRRVGVLSYCGPFELSLVAHSH
jgi:hypothetical protein